MGRLLGQVSMGHIELGGYERIWLEKESEYDGTCHITREDIPRDSPRITLITEGGIPGSVSRTISLGVVDRVIQAVEGGGEVELEEWGRWAVTRFEGEEGCECLICGDQWYEGEALGVDIRSHTVPGEPIELMGIVHEGCRDEFAKALEEVWEYGDEFLADRI